MAEVTMPRLSDTMEEGELAKWLKNVGDAVAKGDVIAEIETDKATMDLEANEDGILEQQLVEEGTLVPIGQPVAIIGDGSGKAAAPAELKEDEPVEASAAVRDAAVPTPETGVGAGAGGEGEKSPSLDAEARAVEEADQGSAVSKPAPTKSLKSG